MNRFQKLCLKTHSVISQYQLQCCGCSLGMTRYGSIITATCLLVFVGLKSLWSIQAVAGIWDIGRGRGVVLDEIGVAREPYRSGQGGPPVHTAWFSPEQLWSANSGGDSRFPGGKLVSVPYYVSRHSVNALLNTSTFVSLLF